MGKKLKVGRRAKKEVIEDDPFKVLRTGITDCCQAEVDTTHVIKEGRHKGHGRYYCSKCKQLLFMV